MLEDEIRRAKEDPGYAAVARGLTFLLTPEGITDELKEFYEPKVNERDLSLTRYKFEKQVESWVNEQKKKKGKITEPVK